MKHLILILLVVLVVSPLIFGIGTQDDPYRCSYVELERPVTIRWDPYDPNGIRYPGNRLTLDVNGLPAGFIVEEVGQFSQPGQDPNALCWRWQASGILTPGEYTWTLIWTDFAGNQSWAEERMTVLPKDTTPPVHVCGGISG